MGYSCIDTRKCSRCGETKNCENDFYVNKRAPNGGVYYFGKCKKCLNKISTEYQKTPRGMKVKERVFSKWYKENWREYYEQNKDRILSHGRRWRNSNKDKVRAESIANRKYKDICFPCSICGNKTTHKHHEDYSKPLDITWLCAKHHRLHHVAKDVK